MDDRTYSIEKARHFTEKADQCRRLAAAIANQNDPAVTALVDMARQFETRAAALAEKTDD
jgi:hypothetical protein